ncbi:uncharacterized protein LOC110068375 isoform X2 [Orbicella faveolata]|uniref:uncharacterized protein LOC110068375 isoform X2 n=1 Tax=Orbicella faveolata TaxID=48498 RepID=UPI0009E31971|nr:uncharacterized protein LOC110068375 isoform X2 [Orbicella faveolata]
MARNCEKKLIGLNRLWLAKQQKEELEKSPKRPHLRSLNSATEVKRWIPGIKREMDYYLDLSGARQHRYPDTKIKEFENKVEELENEYKRFVRKVYELDPSTTGVPWQPRGYVSKRKNLENSQTEVKPKKICTPLLEGEVRKSISTKSDDQSHCSKFYKRTDCISSSSTEQGSDQALKINKDNDFKNVTLDDVDVQAKNILGLDYESSSDSDVS